MFFSFRRDKKREFLHIPNVHTSLKVRGKNLHEKYIWLFFAFKLYRSGETLNINFLVIKHKTPLKRQRTLTKKAESFLHAAHILVVQDL